MWKIDDDDDDDKNEMRVKSLEEQKAKFSWKRARNLLWQHFRESYSNKTVLTWSIWWALNQAGFFLVINYVQLLWQQIDPDQESFYNGAVEALLTLFGALSAILAGYVLGSSFEKYDVYLLSLCSFIEGGLILISSATSSIYVSYIMYIFFGILFHFIITIVTAFVARLLSEDSFALIFGINTLVALLIQTIFTVLFVADTSLIFLTPREQFNVFGYYFIGLGVIYLLWIVVKKCFK